MHVHMIRINSLSMVCLLAMFFTVFPLFAAEPATESEVEPELIESIVWMPHVMSLRFDVGSGWQLGGGYLYASERRAPHTLGWRAIGGNVNLVRRNGRWGGVVYGTVGVGSVGFGGGMSFELSAGIKRYNEQWYGVGVAGIFISVRFVELGYSFQPILLGGEEAPELGRHFLSVRANIPFYNYSHSPTVIENDRAKTIR